MAERRGRRRPEGRPSPAAQARLASELRREIAELEVRAEEAGLRAEALLALGKTDAAAAAVAEQQALVEELRQRLERTVSAAVVERDAEAVVAAALAADTREVTAGRAVIDAPRRHPVLVGAASALAVLAAVALSVLPGDPSPDVDLAGAAEVGETPSAAGGPSGSTTLRPGDDPAAPPTSAPDSVSTAPTTQPQPGPGTEATTGGEGDATPTARSSGEPDGEDGGLTGLVEDLLDAVNGVVPTEGELDLPVPPILEPEATESASPTPSPSPSSSESEDATGGSLRDRWSGDGAAESTPEPSADATDSSVLSDS